MQRIEFNFVFQYNILINEKALVYPYFTLGHTIYIRCKTKFQPRLLTLEVTFAVYEMQKNVVCLIVSLNTIYDGGYNRYNEQCKREGEYMGNLDYEKYCAYIKLLLESPPESELHVYGNLRLGQIAH